MRRWTVVVAAAILAASACRDGGSGREGLRRVDDRALDVAAIPARVTVLHPGAGAAAWLAAGDSPEGRGRVATLWRSREGLGWERQPLPEGGGAIVRGAARQGDVLVLVGDRAEGGSGRRAPAVWVAQGEDQPAAVPGALPGGGGTVLVRQVVGGVAGGQGFLALGTVDGRLSFWRSGDGRAWTQAERLDVFMADSAVAQLVATASGVVAVGGEGGGPAAWWSPDGAVWSRAGFSGAARGRITAVAVGPDGLRAAGSTPTDTGADRRPLPAVWRSVDGQSWEPVPASFDSASQPNQDNRGSEIKTLVRADDGYVATGGSAQARRVWSSPDGVAWAEAELQPEVRAATRLDLALAAAAGNDVLVGSSVEVLPPRLLLRRQGRWVDASVATPLSPPRPVAVESGVVAAADGFVLWANTIEGGPGLAEEGGGARLWRSSDGRSWRPLEGSSAFDLAFVLSMVPDANGGLVAVGTEPSVAPVVSEGVPHAKAWVSSDSASWLLDDAPFRDETVSQSLSGVARRGNRVVAVGSLTRTAVDFDAVFWVRDGSGPWRRVRGVPRSEGEGAEGAARVCAGRPGWVALGTGSDTPVAWSSADAESWQPVQDRALAAAGEDIRTCIGVGGRLLAVGSARNPGGRRSAAAWTSTDGRSWTASASPALRADVDLRIDHVAAEGNDVVAVGVEGQGGNRPIALWRSTDCGGSWDRAPVDNRLFPFIRERAVTGVAVRDGLAVVTGVLDGQVAVWTVPLADLPTSGGNGRNCG
ncbi:MAG TPA: hypothetical protein VHF24_12020 [Acidimicrobiales bacterium]|nr:hypothetical protein [Acidimicrobiales bacterium]